MRHRRLIPVALALSVACASAGGGGGSALSSSTLGPEDVRHAAYNDVFELLENHALLDVVRAGGGEAFAIVDRGPASFGHAGGPPGALLILDGSRMTLGYGTLLRAIDLENVRSIRILRPAEAGSRFGTRAAGGVIIVTTGRD